MSDTKFATGAVRSADAAKFSFTSLPMVGLLALARTAGEGAEKYGRLNYLQGMPVHDLLEHTFKHLVMYNAGDRSEPHLAHAAWGLLVAIQEEVLRPEAQVAHMLGAGCSITPAIQAHMDEQKPILAANRAERGPDAFTWNIYDLPDVRKLRDQRVAVNATLAQIQVNEADRKALKAAILNAEPGRVVVLDESIRTVWGAIDGPLDVDDDGFFVLPQTHSMHEPAPSVADPDQHSHSSGNPAVDAYAATLHSHSPLAHAKQNVAAKPHAESYVPIAPETLKAWCDRNPRASDAIQAKDLGLSATGCPEPFATFPEMAEETVNGFLGSKARKLKPYEDGDTLYFGRHPESNPGGYFPEKYGVNKAGYFKVKSDHAGGCPPLP
jgi:hypothetical protein